MFRFDRVDITGKAKRTSEGYLRADAVVTRAGVFTYRNADGSVRKEFRSPEEVMRADSLETLKLRPITNGHPPTLLNAATAKKYQVGSTGETVHPAGMLVLASMLVTDGRAVQDAADGKVELSCGYECDVVDSRGTFDGQEYTHEQKNIKYNHVALVEKGRAGSEARLPRFDSMTAEQVAEDNEPNAPRIVLRKSCMKDLGNGIAVELPPVHMDVWSDEARKAAIEARKNGPMKPTLVHYGKNPNATHTTYTSGKSMVSANGGRNELASHAAMHKQGLYQDELGVWRDSKSSHEKMRSDFQKAHAEVVKHLENMRKEQGDMPKHALIHEAIRASEKAHSTRSSNESVSGIVKIVKDKGSFYTATPEDVHAAVRAYHGMHPSPSFTH